jgi:hypothetical protein
VPAIYRVDEEYRLKKGGMEASKPARVAAEGSTLATGWAGRFGMVRGFGSGSWHVSSMRNSLKC